ncbi:MarR family winged helix-turn-helix transcriptional regulator [Ahrensia kielensis]|uniref:MarR family winged helix-turn-helix transcriptional regulator n=1 Tax=Ahrensia kielensis TaxID=76980 RepID=UPI000A040914|nr:MarR family transcriptional regulator [Ahrensia kielensis]
MDTTSELSQLMNHFVRRMKIGMQQRVKEIAPEGFGPQGAMVLKIISDAQPLPINALVSELARDKSQVTRMVSELERHGLIVRSLDANDARVRLLSLTEDGQKLTTSLTAAMADVIGDILAPLSTGEQTQLATLMRKI